jgi:hypothetical protein
MFKTTTSVALFVVMMAFGLSTVQANGEEQGKPAKVLTNSGTEARNGVLAIAGVASSATNCVGAAGGNVHAIGFVPASTQITITFSSDFDPVAAVTLTQLGQDAPDRLARAQYVADDDSGGNLEPEIRFTTTFSGTVTLHVSKFSAERQSGCYFYKVEVRTP